MTPEEHKAAFAAAAQATQELIAAQEERREHLRQKLMETPLGRQLAAVDVEVERLRALTRMLGPDAEPVAEPAMPPPPRKQPQNRKKKNAWVSIVTAELAIAEPDGIIYTDLLRVLRSAHGYQHSQGHLKLLLDRKEKEQVFYRDELRRWHPCAQPVVVVDENVRPTGDDGDASSWTSQLTAGPRP